MLPLKIDDILKYLVDSKFKAEIQTQTGQICMTYHLGGHNFPIFIKIDEKYGTLQALLFFPCKMNTKAPPEMARLLHLLNKEIDFPGLGMDEHANLVFYRCVLLAPNDLIDELQLGNTILSMLHAAPVLYPMIESVAGGVYFEAIASDARKALHKFSK